MAIWLRASIFLLVMVLYVPATVDLWTRSRYRGLVNIPFLLSQPRVGGCLVSLTHFIDFYLHHRVCCSLHVPLPGRDGAVVTQTLLIFVSFSRMLPQSRIYLQQCATQTLRTEVPDPVCELLCPEETQLFMAVPLASRPPLSSRTLRPDSSPAPTTTPCLGGFAGSQASYSTK